MSRFLKKISALSLFLFSFNALALDVNCNWTIAALSDYWGGVSIINVSTTCANGVGGGGSGATSYDKGPSCPLSQSVDTSTGQCVDLPPSCSSPYVVSGSDCVIPKIPTAVPKSVVDANGGVAPDVIGEDGDIWTPETTQCSGSSPYCYSDYVPTGETAVPNSNGNYDVSPSLYESTEIGAPSGYDENGFIDFEGPNPFSNPQPTSSLPNFIVDTETSSFSDQNTTTQTDFKKDVSSDGTITETTTTTITDTSTGVISTREDVIVISTDGKKTTSTTGTQTDTNGTTTTFSGSGSGFDKSPDITTGTASNSCSQRPNCSDSSVECAILIQQWNTMCAGFFVEPTPAVSFGDASPYLADAKAEYASLIESIRSEFTSTFSLSVPNSSAVPIENIKSIRGADVDFSLVKFLPSLSTIGNIVIALAYLYSAFIILRP